MPDLTHEQYADESAELLREQMTAGNSSPELVTVAGHLAYAISRHAELAHDEEHAEARRLLDAISYEPTSPVGSVPLA
jgi:hypothetical protein